MQAPCNLILALIVAKPVLFVCFDLQVSDKNVALTSLNLMVVKNYVNGVFDSTFVKNYSDSLKNNSKYLCVVGLSRY